MSDPNEIRALKASLGGATDTAAALAAIQPRIESLPEQEDIPADLLEELARLSAAHAIASAALRGLVNAAQTRRGATTA